MRSTEMTFKATVECLRIHRAAMATATPAQKSQMSLRCDGSMVLNGASHRLELEMGLRWQDECKNNVGPPNAKRAAPVRCTRLVRLSFDEVGLHNVRYGPVFGHRTDNIANSSAQFPNSINPS